MQKRIHSACLADFKKKNLMERGKRLVIEMLSPLNTSQYLCWWS